MSKKKTETKQASTQNTSFANQNQYGWQQTPGSPDASAYRDWQPEVDPSISYRYGRARNKLSESLDSPMGQYTTPAIREATQRAAEGDLTQQEGQEYRQGQYDVNNQQGAKLGSLAALTAPRMVETGSTGTGTGATSGTGSSVQSGGLLEAFLMGGAGNAGGGAGTAIA